MNIHIGPYVYKLRIADVSIDKFAIRNLGDTQEIWLSGQIATSARLEFLFQAVRERWQIHTAKPRDEDEKGSLENTIIAGLSKDLAAGGGTSALERMMPEPFFTDALTRRMHA